jgi:hypothetical protein
VRETWRESSLTSILKMKHLTLFRGSVSSTWREGSYFEDTERYVVEGSGTGAFLL